jgi:hypothetical protein
MMTKIFLSAAAVLALLSFAWPAQSVLHFLATLTICVAAIFAALQAGSEGRYYWLGGFIVLALLLNPVVPVASDRIPAMVLAFLGLAMIASWVIVLRGTTPTLSASQVLHSRDTP